MNVQEAHLVVFSPCGGTMKVGRALLKDFELPLTLHDLTKVPDRRTQRNFSESSLVFFVFPVYGGRLPPNVGSIFENLKGDGTPCALIAVYGNRAFEGALLDLHNFACSNGFTPVAAAAAIAEHSMAPTVAHGRPDGVDAATLAEFGREILALARKGHTLAKAPGAYPQWNIPADTYFYPILDRDKCVSCGICLQNCPVGAINATTPPETDTRKCIMCSACVKYCPEQARIMGDEKTRTRFKPHLQAASVARHEPELFC